MEEMPSLEERGLGGLIDGVASHPDVALPVLDILEPHNFSLQSCRAVLMALKSMCNSERPVSLATLYQFFCERDVVGTIVGAPDLLDLWQARCDVSELRELARQIVG